MDFNRLTQHVSKIKVKNVVDMPLFYGLLILLFAIIASIFSTYIWVTIVLFCFAGLLFLMALFGYLYFTFKNPDYLRSEEYQLKKQSLEILGDKDNLLPVEAGDIVEITNPYNLLEEEITESENE